MIVVIADDFSGAAEIAGVAWRYGLDCEIQSKPDLHVHRDLVVIDTNTRSLSSQEASDIMKKIIDQIKSYKYDWIFKKVDSVLRGHILTELKILLSKCSADRILLIPANPSTGRVIKNGIYYINNVPLQKTPIANDPEFPARNSGVLQLLGQSEHVAVHLLDRPAQIVEKGVIIGQADSLSRLNEWAAFLQNGTLAAGGADFFRSVLAKKTNAKVQRQARPVEQSGKRLYIISSTAPESREELFDHNADRIKICHLSCQPGERNLFSDQCLDVSIKHIIQAFDRYTRIAVLPSTDIKKDMTMIKQLPRFLSGLVFGLYKKSAFDQLVIAGGTGASHIIRRLGWKKLFPVNEISAGVVMLKVVANPRVHVIIKPGSYPWPAQIVATT